MSKARYNNLNFVNCYLIFDKWGKRMKKKNVFITSALLLAIAAGVYGQSEAAKEAKDRGVTAYKQKDYDKAIEEFSEAIRLYPDYALVYYYRAEAYCGKDDYDRGIADFTRAIQLDPEDEDYLSERGFAYIIIKDYDRAIADFTEALQLNPDSEDAIEGLAIARQRKQDSSADSGQAFAPEASDFEMDGTTLVRYNGNTANVIIPDNVTAIGKDAFSGGDLQSVTIHSGVLSIEEGAFGNCPDLADITVDTRNIVYSSVDGVLFNKARTKLIRYPCGKAGNTYTIPSRVSSVENYAFRFSENLTSVTIGANVTSVGDSAFAYCQNLTSITLSQDSPLSENAFPHNVRLVYGDSPASPAQSAPAEPKAIAPQATANVNPNFIPPSAWAAGDGDAPGVTKRIFNTREAIAGQEKDVLTLEVTFPKQNGGKWATYTAWDESYVSRLRTATGIRFKVLGDGKTWNIQIQTKETESDWCGFVADIKTVNNKVVEINIPFSSLKQPSWGKKATWIKSNILGINIQRNSSSNSESGTSTLKVFDFEMY